MPPINGPRRTRQPRTTRTAPSTPVTPRPAPNAPTGTPASTNVDGASWRNFVGGPKPQARITGFSSPLQDRTGLLRFEWEKKGDRVPFEMAVDVQGDASRIRAEVWSNVNRNDAPGTYDAIPMKLARIENGKAIFRADIPVDRIGNYRAVGRLSVDGGTNWQWAGQNGVADIRFRPRDEAFDKLNIEEVNIGNVNFDPATGRYGTLADMMDPGSPTTNGKYTLEWLAAQGKTAIWMMPPFEASVWDGRHPVDDAGSPYAAKDFFPVRTDLSRAARGLTGEAAHQAALDELKAFMKQAHKLGIKVILDIPLNHVGHNYEFRDLFVTKDAEGREVRELRKNDFSNVATNAHQLDVIKKRLEDPAIPDYMEFVAPWLYGSRSGFNGARDASDKAPGGWFEWPDTAQLNHGRMRHGYHWWDEAPTTEQRAMQGWLTRVLQFWAVDMKVDGFRLDHLTGLPLNMLEEGLNLVQADVDRNRPGTNLFVMGEDFHTSGETRHWLDNNQGGYFHGFLAAKTPADFQNLVESPWFHDLLNLDSHDEERFITHFGGERPDHRAATRLAALMQVFGGPVAEVAGAHFGETFKLPFKQYRGVVSLRTQTDAGREMASVLGNIGRIRKENAALHDDNRAFLRPRVGGADADLLALSRWPDEKNGQVMFALANLNNHQVRENAFQLDEEVASRLQPDKRYQVTNLMGANPDLPLWNPPLTGRELVEKGIFAKLQPYEIQMLKLHELP